MKACKNVFLSYFSIALISMSLLWARPFPVEAASGAFPEILVKYQDSKEPILVKSDDGESLDSLLSRYSSLPGVEYAEPNFSYRASVLPSDTYYNKQWYLDKIRAPYAWDKIRETPGVVVAVIDSGVQIKHPDLYPNIWINEDEIPGNNKDDDGNGFIDDYNGWDFIGNVPDPSPKFEDGFNESGIMHGTLVAGIIGAVGNNQSGVSGISWNVKIMPLRVLDDQGAGRTNEVVRAIDYAIANKADIINFSFVGFDYSKSLYEAIKRAYAAGILMVAAAGNESDQGAGYDLNDTPMYPACSEGDDNMVIGVAATDAVDQKANFSSYGFRCVDVSAPGVSFYGLAVYRPTKKIGSRPFDQYFGGYWSGTSMATPVAAGVLALIQGSNQGLKPAEVRDILLASSDNIGRLNPSYVGQLGSGRVNAFAAINLAERTLKDRRKKILAAAYSGQSSEVKVFEADGSLSKSFKVGDSKNGWMAVGADIDGNRRDEIVVAPGPGQKPEVKVFYQDGKLKNSFLAYSRSFLGGVSLAAGDVDGDGQDEIISSPKTAGGPHIRIFDGQGNVKGQFFAYDKSFRGGVSVAAGDVDGDGLSDIITGAGQGGGPHIRVFNGQGRMTGSFYAFNQSFSGGVGVGSVSIGD